MPAKKKYRTDHQKKEAILQSQAKWKKANTRAITLRFFLASDADVLAAIDGKSNKTDYIRRLIRKDIEEERE